MSGIDVKLALLDLDRRTPVFFVEEIPRHSDMRVIYQVKEILRVGLKPTRAVADLKEVLT